MDIGAVRADISLLKGRIGEGFVEAILRRAGYFVARVGRETQMPRLMKSGTDTYLPDLLAWRQENTGGEQGDTPLYRFVAVPAVARLPRGAGDRSPPGGPFVFPSRQMEQRGRGRVGGPRQRRA